MACPSQDMEPSAVSLSDFNSNRKHADCLYLDGPAKAAAIHLTKMTASKLAPKNIMVNVICPGVFPSRMTNFGLEKYGKALTAGQPTGRIGKPSDFGGLVLFLSSRASAHMTGNAIEIDGGATLSGWRGTSRGDSESKL